MYHPCGSVSSLSSPVAFEVRPCWGFLVQEEPHNSTLLKLLFLNNYIAWKYEWEISESVSIKVL